MHPQPNSSKSSFQPSGPESLVSGAPSITSHNRFRALDGWRGISILFVLAGHLFPLGPEKWGMNVAVSATGMAIFFILSGFLITNLLIRDSNVIPFLIRRFMRIVPLAWLFMAIVLWFESAEGRLYAPHFLFYANWEPISLIPATGHLWSLCMEMQFYVFIAILVATLGRRALWVLPVLALLATLYRYANGVQIAINTPYRLDEILAGCTLALIYNYRSEAAKAFFHKLSPTFLMPLLFMTSNPQGDFLNYFRPYVAMLMIGSTLFDERDAAFWPKLLCNKILFYIGTISYALYVIHGGLMHSWLSEGSKVAKYAKRPLLLLITFGLAHLSTFHYEKHFIALGKKMSAFTVRREKVSPTVSDA